MICQTGDSSEEVLAAYWFIMSIEDGAPGQLNILVLLRAWNTIKLIPKGPTTVILLFFSAQDVIAQRCSCRAEEAQNRGQRTGWVAPLGRK